METLWKVLLLEEDDDELEKVRVVDVDALEEVLAWTLLLHAFELFLLANLCNALCMGRRDERVNAVWRVAHWAVVAPCVAVVVATNRAWFIVAGCAPMLIRSSCLRKSIGAPIFEARSHIPTSTAIVRIISIN